MRRRRARSVVRWGCTLAAMVVLGAAVFSLFSSAAYVSVSPDGRNAWYLRVSDRRLRFLMINGYDKMGFSLHRGWTVGERFPWAWGMSNSGSLYARRGEGDFMKPVKGALAVHDVGVTLLYPFLLTAVPAALLWHADRRRPGPGHCASCGYDRRGLAPAAACPECGTIPAA